MTLTNSSNVTKSVLRKKMKSIIASIPLESKQLQSDAVISLVSINYKCFKLIITHLLNYIIFIEND